MNKDIPYRAEVLYDVLLNDCGNTGSVTASVKQLTELCGFSRYATYRALDDLLNAGYISATPVKPTGYYCFSIQDINTNKSQKYTHKEPTDFDGINSYALLQNSR
jgi:hypothetical protein